MEGSVHHQSRTLRTNGHVLWNVQFTSNIPSYDGRPLQTTQGEGYCIVYMDDILIYAESKEKLCEATLEVLKIV